MKEVEELLTRLDAAEALYPSTQTMGAFHSAYKSESFVGRIKTMCLWYNITQQARLKLTILGKILVRLQGERFSWPVQTSFIANEVNSGHSSASGADNDDSAVNSLDSTKMSSSTLQQKMMRNLNGPKVQFLIDDVSHAGDETTSSAE